MYMLSHTFCTFLFSEHCKNESFWHVSTEDRTYRHVSVKGMSAKTRLPVDFHCFPFRKPLWWHGVFEPNQIIQIGERVVSDFYTYWNNTGSFFNISLPKELREQSFVQFLFYFNCMPMKKSLKLQVINVNNQPACWLIPRLIDKHTLTCYSTKKSNGKSL